jgi:hypothetical protein
MRRRFNPAAWVTPCGGDLRILPRSAIVPSVRRSFRSLLLLSLIPRHTFRQNPLSNLSYSSFEIFPQTAATASRNERQRQCLRIAQYASSDG